ncbi:hypothetical protein M378DRAFT_166329, partial [Amanita muscaria Koide BX008]
TIPWLASPSKFNLVLIRVGQSRADAGGSQLDSQTMDRRKLLSGRHHHHPSSTQEQTITLRDAEKGVLSNECLWGGSGNQILVTA